MGRDKDFATIPGLAGKYLRRPGRRNERHSCAVNYNHPNRGRDWPLASPPRPYGRAERDGVEIPGRRRFTMPEYTVPPLQYDYAALEPHIDEQTMRIHHDKHHAAYVNNLNAALKDYSDLS